MSGEEKPVTHLVVGGGEVNKFAEALRNLKRGLATQIEYEQVMAQIVRAKYQALMKEGFTAQEALELCKK